MRIKFEAAKIAKLNQWCGTRIWEKPKEGHIYVVGADVAEGVGQDASCAAVIDVTKGYHVATFWSNAIDPDNYAAYLYKLGNFYSKAQLVVEQNNHGNAVISNLTGAVGGLAYPNLYRRYVLDQFTQKRTRTVGFRTAASTKPALLGNVKAALRDGGLVTHDREMINEMNSFIVDARTGKIGAKGKARDDRVIALALAWEGSRILKERRVKTELSFSRGTPRFDDSTGFPIY